MRALLKLPVVVQLILLLAPAMFAAAAIAVVRDDAKSGGVFAIYWALTASVGIMAALAVRGQKRRWLTPERSISGLLGAYLFIPLLASLPLMALAPGSTPAMAYFEMMSAFTTTGATLYAPDELPIAVHFWRALVGWIGGGVTLVLAFTIMAPLRIGGFEMGDSARRLAGRADEHSSQADPVARLERVIRLVVPIYAGLTAVLVVVLMAAGDGILVAVCHGMSVLATSGISPVGGLPGGGSGTGGEIAVLVFLMAAFSHRVFGGAGVFGAGGPVRDPEVRTGMVLIAAVSLVLMGHWFAVVYAGGQGAGPGAAISAVWGVVFTATSFLTTTGFQSASWDASGAFSDLPAIGLVLLMLAFAGGGVATTAGGIKLLRIFALYKHGLREIEKLVHPSSVGGYGARARRIRREGAFVAWVFVMLFFLTYGGMVLALAASGAGFETALVLAGAALANAGPLAGVFGDTVAGYSQLSAEARGVLCIGMLVGRVEVLAVIAVLNPEYWRG